MRSRRTNLKQPETDRHDRVGDRRATRPVRTLPAITMIDRSSETPDADVLVVDDIRGRPVTTAELDAIEAFLMREIDRLLRPAGKRTQ